MKRLTLLFLLLTSTVFGQTTLPPDSLHYKTILDIPYKTEGEAYELERCKLDLYLPKQQQNFPLLVWLHGGGITINSKDSLEASEVGVRLASEGIGTAVISYRLSPQATFPAYIDDVAAALRWVYDHAKEYNGQQKELYVGGHSAGGYLAAMVALDPTYLEAYKLKPRQLAGVVAISGQMDSHQTTKKERNLPAEEKIINETAPLFFVSKAKKLPPFLVLYAENDLPQRGAINVEFADSMQVHQQPVMLREIKGRDHLSIIRNILQPNDETTRLITEFILEGEVFVGTVK
uniref:Alpha/beta hydrolase n=1 Tax=Roseihalotalea indica TaxID=2867963 RepID=A0AA49GMK9_9BACT|nr:alpha/beta hydrolase [Tunicatimonas sp. TK19036]